MEQVPNRTIWLAEDGETVKILDQRWLPWDVRIERIRTVEAMATAIRDMHIRGAGAIGAAAGFGMYLACREAASSNALPDTLARASRLLLSTRPTAVNLEWAVRRQERVLLGAPPGESVVGLARAEAIRMADEDVEACRKIGQHGLRLIREIHERRDGRPVQVLTHCNAGWLAFVEHGTATAPIYAAHAAGIDVHVWVDETRPRNQGARLTAWELDQRGVPHTVIADNAGGHLMQRGMVDLVLVGCDRATQRGDVANKIGTYLKALSAKDNSVPFYVAFPTSSIDWQADNGLQDIPIEERGQDEVHSIEGLLDAEPVGVLLTPRGTACANPAFDVTPARLISGLITEMGLVAASQQGLSGLRNALAKSP